MTIEDIPNYQILGPFPHGWAGMVCIVILACVIAGCVIHARSLL